MLSLSRDMRALDRAVERLGDCRLIVIDPISAYLDGTDANSNHQVRNLLLRLSLLAQQRNCAVLLVSHLRKNSVGKAVHRTLGSLAFTAAARTVWNLSADPHDPDRRLFLPVKLNLVTAPTALAFRIIDGRVDWCDAALALDADELQEHGTHEADAADRLAEARVFLAQLLAPGPQPATAVKQQAKRHRISKRALWDAKRDLGIEALRDPTPGHAHWFWRLPSSAPANC